MEPNRLRPEKRLGLQPENPGRDFLKIMTDNTPSTLAHRGTPYRQICAICFFALSGVLLFLSTPAPCLAPPPGEPARTTPDPKRLSLAISGAYEGAEKDIWWLAAKERSYRSPREIEQHIELDWLQGFNFRTIRRGDPSRKWVALTFDDGPHASTTPQLLKILKEYHAKATFFVVGMMAEANPELVLEESTEGHLLANHTYHHVNLTKIPEKYIAVELDACSLVLEHITGKRTRFFRPPGGDYNPLVSKLSENLGYTMVLWTDDPGDYASPGDRLVESRLLARISSGGIILLHDGVKETLEILPRILSILKAEGYSFVTVDAFLDSKPRW